MGDYIDGVGHETEQFSLYCTDEYRALITPLDDKPALRAACTLISQHKGGFLLDLSPSNLMLRGDSLVITDPYCVDYRSRG